MKSLFIFLLPFFLFITCKSKSNTASQTVEDTVENNYPSEIKNLGIEKLFDKSKWYLYCIHSDEKLNFTRQSGISDTNITYGMLQLKFDHLEVRNDTVEIDFFFYYQNKRVDVLLVNNEPFWGMVYVIPSDSIIMFSTTGVARYMWFKCIDPQQCKDRKQIPLQPEVIQYIKDNRNKLDPWFRKEAIKRGVIKE